MTILTYALTYLCLFLFGSCIASFLNVIAWRTPRGISPFKGRRSFCPGCDVRIKAYDLVPVFSFLALRGKCRNCGVKIPTRDFISELILGAAAVLIFFRFGISPLALFAFVFAGLLLLISLIDLETMTIPDWAIIAIAVLALLSLLLEVRTDIIQRLIGFFVISLPMLIICLIIPDAFGGGDIKLMAVCGFLLGWKNTLLAFFIGAVLGAIAVVILLVRKKTKKGAHIPFGPALSAGCLIAFMYGDVIIKSYSSLFGI